MNLLRRLTKNHTLKKLKTMPYAISDIQDKPLRTLAEKIYAITTARAAYEAAASGLHQIGEDAKAAAAEAREALRENPSREAFLAFAEADATADRLSAIDLYRATIDSATWYGTRDSEGLIYSKHPELKELLADFTARIVAVVAPLLEASKLNDIKVSEDMDLANVATSRMTSDLEGILTASTASGFLNLSILAKGILGK